MKRLVRTTIGRPFEAECSIGHISLHKDEGMDTTEILDTIAARLADMHPFEIHMRNFSAFKNSKTIYLDVINKGCIPDVFETITRLPYEGVPHVTLAKNLAKQDFERAWNILNQQTFNTSFTCDRIKVLKKSTRRWLHYTDLRLKENRNLTRSADIHP